MKIAIPGRMILMVTKVNVFFSTNNNIYKGNFLLGKDFKPNIQKIEDEKVAKSIASHLFEVCIHLSLIHI